MDRTLSLVLLNFHYPFSPSRTHMQNYLMIANSLFSGLEALSANNVRCGCRKCSVAPAQNVVKWYARPRDVLLQSQLREILCYSECECIIRSNEGSKKQRMTKSGFLNNSETKDVQQRKCPSWLLWKKWRIKFGIPLASRASSPVLTFRVAGQAHAYARLFIFISLDEEYVLMYTLGVDDEYILFLFLLLFTCCLRQLYR